MLNYYQKMVLINKTKGKKSKYYNKKTPEEEEMSKQEIIENLQKQKKI